jgi:hypothetical protein
MLLRHVILTLRVVERGLTMMVRCRVVMARGFVMRRARLRVPRTGEATLTTYFFVKLASMRSSRRLSACAAGLHVLLCCSASLRHVHPPFSFSRSFF